MLADAALLRLLQLCSPALPIGAFAYSQALEPAVAAGWVRDEPTAARWIAGLLDGSLATLDLPILQRLHDCFGNPERVPEPSRDGLRPGEARAPSTRSFLVGGAATPWTALLFAARPSAELQAEDRHLGAALARVLCGLDIPEASAWAARPDLTYAAMFALAAARWQIPARAALGAYAFVWCEMQVSAAVRLVPLGQSAGQRVLSSLGAAIPAAVARASSLGDDDIGAAAPSHAIASALHETQYSRLFRS